MKPETSIRTLGDRALSRCRNSAYRLRMARGIENVRAAQTLQFLVFNVELNEGLEQSFVTCRDADPFDDICDHRLVENLVTSEVVGTYWLQTGLTAALTTTSRKEWSRRMHDAVCGLKREFAHITPARESVFHQPASCDESR